MKTIEAGELRIGNYGINQQGEFYKVTWIDSRIEGQLTPIPLNEDILLKCGFVEEDFSSGRILINQLNGIDNGFIIPRYTRSVVISTLHQLQNIHFALTSEELNIQL